MALEVSPGLQAGKQVSFGRAPEEKPNTLLEATGSMVAGGAAGAITANIAKSQVFPKADALTLERITENADRFEKTAFGLLKTVVEEAFEEASGEGENATPKRTAGNLVDDAMNGLKNDLENIFNANKDELEKVKVAKWGKMAAIGAGIGLGLYAGYRALFARGNK